MLSFQSCFVAGEEKGRSGDVGATQPKAAGSSLISQLTRKLAKVELLSVFCAVIFSVSTAIRSVPKLGFLVAVFLLFLYRDLWLSAMGVRVYFS